MGETRAKRGNSNSARRGEDVAKASQPGKYREHKLTEKESIPMDFVKSKLNKS